MTNDLHKVYLSLGSNIEPHVHLPKAVQLLHEYGQVSQVSSVWESHAVGSEGPNFLNACVCFLTQLLAHDLKENAIRQIEAELGRVRFADKNAPRTIDIDILLFDQEPFNVNYWEYAFVAVPLAELIPEYIHPLRLKKLALMSEQLQSQVWIVPRRDVLIS